MTFRSAWMRKVLKQSIARLKIGAYCSVCAQATSSDVDLCEYCERLLIRLRHADRLGHETELCVACGAQTATSGTGGAHLTSSSVRLAQAVCNQCASTPVFLTRIMAPYRYDFPLDRLIQRVKYNDQRQMARVLGTLLARSVALSVNKQDYPDFLIPVPLHKLRELQRGFNQSRDIAHWCSRQLQIPMRSEFASRVADTRPLAGLSRAERQHQILGAFRASPAVAGLRVAIVDDVLTTGSTAKELARELYDTGALSVELWVLARTSSERVLG